MVQKEQRITYIDYAKTFVMFLVIFAHLGPSPKYVNSLIYSFHMPFFFILSGYLLKPYIKPLSTIYRYFRKLIVPALFFNLVFILIMLIPYQNGVFNLQKDFGIQPSTSYGATVLDLIVSNLKRILLSGKMSSGPVWFLFSLFFCHLIHLTQIHFKGIIFFVFYIILLISTQFLKYPLYLSQGLIGYSFFYLGTNKKLIDQTLSYPLLFYLPLLLLIPPIIYFNGALSIYGCFMGKLILPFNFILTYLCAIIGSIVVLRLFKPFNQESRITLISKSLITSLGMQAVFIYCYKNIWGYGHNLLITFIASFTILVICFFLHILFLKICPKAIGYGIKH